LLFFCFSAELQQEELLEASGMAVNEERKEPGEVDGRPREIGKGIVVVIEGAMMMLRVQDRRLAVRTK